MGKINWLYIETGIQSAESAVLVQEENIYVILYASGKTGCKIFPFADLTLTAEIMMYSKKGPIRTYL